MSDLAPFVAAALRDRTVVELMEENERQHQVIVDFMKVQVTGPNGNPVYASGRFDEGHYGRVDQWYSTLKSHQHSCSLANLNGVEIRLGGVVQFTLDPQRDQTILVHLDLGDAHDDYGEEKSVKIKADDGSDLVVVVYGWPESNWSPLLRPDAWDAEGSAAFTYFDLMVNPSSQDCFVQFNHIAFDVTKYDAMIRKVKLSDDEIQRREEQLQASAFLTAINSRLEEAGLPANHDHIFMLVTYFLDISAIDDEFEQVFGPLVNIYTLRRDRNSVETYQEIISLIDTAERQITQDNKNRSQALADFVGRVDALIRREENGA